MVVTPFGITRPLSSKKPSISQDAKAEFPITFNVADCYAALTSERVYKSAYALDKAFNMIINGECGMFSPKIISCFQEAREKLEQKALELQK